MAIATSVDDKSFFSAAIVFLYASAAFNVVALQFIAVPYGKHRRRGWGPTVPAPVAWFLMESPTIWLTLILYPLGRRHAHPLSLLAISLFLLHYLHRTVVYPLRLVNLTKKTGTQKNTQPQDGFPVSIALMAFAFNILNAYLQTRSVSHFADYSTWSGVWIWARVLVGVGIFFWGMRVNVGSDLALVQLKREGGGYKIPRGGWFEWVCSPNYMGEAAEWLGWAVVAWSPAAAGFFLYTCSNLVPRARAHLRWYKEKFGAEYPSSRKAIVPLLY